jgi:hypothetical protein
MPSAGIETTISAGKRPLDLIIMMAAIISVFYRKHGKPPKNMKYSKAV